MSYTLLDKDGKPLPAGVRRNARTRKTRDKTLFHYEVIVGIKQANGKYRQLRRRFWLTDDLAAHQKEHELKNSNQAESLTWREAHRRWLAGNEARLSTGHINATETTLRKWTDTFGEKSTIEGTTLAQFSTWTEAQREGTKGRGAQLRHAHLLGIARWCRKRGMVDSIPFEFAPKPLAVLNKRKPATLDQYAKIEKQLPDHMVGIWRLMGLTGMRISAACNLREDAITDSTLTVVTKGNKVVEYPITAEIREVIDSARKWKMENNLQAPTLFCTLRGRPWRHDNYSEQLRYRLGDEYVMPHRLRHMAGTLMAESNLSPDIIQAGLGHGDRSSAEQYIDQTQQMRATALSVVARKLSENVSNNTPIDSKAIKPKSVKFRKKGLAICPCCGCKLSIDK